jgi:hypothetical protein
MEYIISSFNGRKEIRISNEEIEGKLIYKGHRLGLPNELLPKIIYHMYERYGDNFYYLDYKKWKDIYKMEKINVLMTKCWIRETDSKKALMTSYRTLLQTLKEINGDIKNIYIVEN